MTTEKRTLTRTLLTAGVPTPNGRVYSEVVLRQMVEAAAPKVVARTMIGTVAGGPESPASAERVPLADATHILVDLRMEGASVTATVEFLPTPKGLALLRLLDEIYDDATTYMARAGLVASGVGMVRWDNVEAEVREVVESYELMSVSVSVPPHITSVREENAELNELFERQDRRVQAATQLWREETKEWLTQPDLGKLVQWLMDRASNALKENADLKLMLATAERLAVETMNEHPPGSGHSKAYSALFANTYNARETPNALHAELEKLKAAIREHAFERGDDRCWLDDQKLYAAAGIDLDETNTALPPKEEFLGNCARYHACRQKPGDTYVTPAEHLKRVGRTMYNLGARQVLKDSEVEAELEKTITRVKTETA